ncbi:MAG: transporter [Candidatus Poribacteria bacterium]|nr:transporter [Candidatus Poribacteria bacterium]
MKNHTMCITNFLLIFIFFTAAYADTLKQSRADSHAPIGVMADHGHKIGEMMLAYRFMAMDMRGLQSRATLVETADILKDFKMAPTQMRMQMHMLGAMFAPHNRVTLMAMTNYQRNTMQMEGSHQHTHGDHKHPIGHHEMSSAGIGDTKIAVLPTIWKSHGLTILANLGVSLPTGSIAKKDETDNLLPYPMQLGSGSFQVIPGVTLFGFHNMWSYGGQLRGGFPLNINISGYRHGNTFNATAWGARRINNWISLSSRLLLSRRGNITGSHPDLNPNMTPSHRPDFRGSTRLDFAVSSNLIIPTGIFTGQRFAIEFQMPLYQNLAGTQLKTISQLTIGWQYGFKVW